MNNVAKEIAEVLLESIGRTLFELLKAFFQIKGSFDDFKNDFIGAIFGVPGTVVAVVLSIISAIGIIIGIAKLIDKHSN